MNILVLPSNKLNNQRVYTNEYNVVTSKSTKTYIQFNSHIFYFLFTKLLLQNYFMFGRTNSLHFNNSRETTRKIIKLQREFTEHIFNKIYISSLSSFSLSLSSTHTKWCEFSSFLFLNSCYMMYDFRVEKSKQEVKACKFIIKYYQIKKKK